MARRRNWEETQPWTWFNSPPGQWPTLRIESREIGEPIYIPAPSGHPGEKYDTLAWALVELMEKARGGHPGFRDPVGFHLIRQEPGDKSKWMTGGNTHANRGWYGEEPNREPFLMVTAYFHSTGQNVGFASLRGVELKRPASASLELDFTDLTDNEFEAILFRLYKKDPEFTDVKWYQHTNSPDAGRDISATRVTNNARVLIQAKRVTTKSINEEDLEKQRAKTKTWNPPFDEVIVSATTSFTQGAVRWRDQGEADGETPLFVLESKGELEAKLTDYPELLHAFDLWSG